MPFDVLKPVDNNETKIQPTAVENNSNNQAKYDKPEIETFHKAIVKDYPQINENTLEKILKTLNKDLVEQLSIKGFDVIREILKNDSNLLSGEKAIDDVNMIIDFIKDEIEREDTKKIIENANKNTENIKKDTENTNKAIENTKKEIDQSKENLNELYKNIPDKYKDQKKTDELKDQNKVLLDSTEFTNKLEKFGISKAEYIRNRSTALQLSQDQEAPIPNKVEFINEFNKLNRLLDIDIQIPVIEAKSFKSTEVKASALSNLKTSEDQILKVKSIDEYVKDIDNKEDMTEEIKIGDENALEIYDEDDLRKRFAEALELGGQNIDIKEYWDDGELDIKKLEKEVDEDVYKTIVEKRNNFKKNLTETGKDEIKKVTNRIMKERIITNVFAGLSGYFDSTNSNAENFAEDFKLNIDEDISIEGRMVNLNGTIKGYHVGFYYDMEAGKLQMDDVVHKDKDNIYQIGKKNGGKFDLPTKLPTYKDLTDIAKATNVDDIFKNNKVQDIDIHQSLLKEDLDNRISQEFSHKELNKYYIEKYNEKNLAIQENLGYIFDNLGGDLIDFDKNQSFAIETKPEQYKLFNIVDKSLDHYNESGQYLQFRAAFEKFNALISTDKIQDVKKGCKEPLISKLFNENVMQTSQGNRKNGGEINYTTFYETISNDLGIIDLKALEKINTVIEKDETIDEFSVAYTDNYRKREAENNLTKSLENIK